MLCKCLPMASCGKCVAMAHPLQAPDPASYGVGGYGGQVFESATSSKVFLLTQVEDLSTPIGCNEPHV